MDRSTAGKMLGSINKKSWSGQEKKVFINCPYEIFAGQLDAFQGTF